MKNRLPDLNVPARERIGWVDLLRVIACFLVVFSHSCDAFVAVFEATAPPSCKERWQAVSSGPACRCS